MDTNLLNIKQASVLLDLTTDHLRRLIRLGKLPARRVGNKLWFDKADLDNYLIGTPIVPKRRA